MRALARVSVKSNHKHARTHVCTHTQINTCKQHPDRKAERDGRTIKLNDVEKIGRQHAGDEQREREREEDKDMMKAINNEQQLSCEQRAIINSSNLVYWAYLVDPRNVSHEGYVFCTNMASS